MIEHSQEKEEKFITSNQRKNEGVFEFFCSKGLLGSVFLLSNLFQTKTALSPADHASFPIKFSSFLLIDS